MQSIMNLKIKFRESFRPFAPAVLREDVDAYFDVRPQEDSPYMLLVAGVRKDKLLEVADTEARGLEKLKQPRSVIPAVTHVDGSARIQTVDRERHPRLHRILERFKALTGSALVINTSFNVRGEPIVNTPADAYRCFLGTNMDALVLENCILRREHQPQAQQTVDREAYLAQFALD